MQWILNYDLPRGFPGGPVVRTWSFHCCGLGSIPGGGTKILQAVRREKKKRGLPRFLSDITI